MMHLDDEAAMWERVEFARAVANATPAPRYPEQPWEQYDIGEVGGEIVCLLEDPATCGYSAWFRYLGPDALANDTMSVLHLDRVRRLTPAEICAHPLTGPVVARVALAVGLGPDPDPVAAVQAWQETWED